jgi:AraC-type DNA-binding domain-containing proteins
MMKMNKAAQKYIREFRLKSIYVKLYLSCISFMLILVIIVGMIIYHHVSQNFQQEITKSNISELQHMEKEITKKLDVISTMLYGYATNSDILYFTDKPFEENLFLLRDIFNRMNEDIVASSYIDSMYLYYSMSGQLLTNSGIMGMSEARDTDWYSLSRESTAKTVLLPTRRISYELFYQTYDSDIATMTRFFPISTTNSGNAIAININMNAIKKEITQLGAWDNAQIYIINQSGDILLSTVSGQMYKPFKDVVSGDITVRDGSGYLMSEGQTVVFTGLSSYGWRFVHIVPAEQMTRNIAFLKQLFYIVFGIALVSSLFIMFFITNLIYTPIVSLLETFYERRANKPGHIFHRRKNELEELQVDIANFSENFDLEKKSNILLRAQVDGTKSALTIKCFCDLIFFNDISAKSAVKELHSYGWPDGPYAALIIIIDDHESYRNDWSQEDQGLWSFALINITEEIIGYHCQNRTFQTASNEFVSVVSLFNDDGSSAAENLPAMADEVRNTISKHIKLFSITVSVGSASNNLSGLFDSYSSALNALQRRWLIGKNTTILYSDTSTVCPKNIYNPEKEKLIINALKACDSECAYESLNQFLHELEEKNGQVYENIYQGILLLLAAVLRMLYEMGYEQSDVLSTRYNLFYELGKNKTMAETSLWLKKLFSDIIAFFETARNRKNKIDINVITQYITEHYHHPNIYLDELSRLFDMNASYLSRAFKRETGSNFLDFLNQTRINKAKELLVTTELSVAAVCTTVGYQSDQTFIRIFKKLEGITPGAYRSQSQALTGKATKKE